MKAKDSLIRIACPKDAIAHKKRFPEK